MENLDLDLSSKLKLYESQSHGIIRRYKCTECGLSFERASQFDYHRRSIHLNEKSQLCEICGKSFFRKTDLQTHLNIHSGNNSCICEICGRSFNHISNLIRHCRIHEGVKPYPCSVCGKRFNQINSLARHKRIHQRSVDEPKLQSTDKRNEEEKEKSISNESVEGTLTQRKILKRQHYCKICGESFGLVLLLRQHEKLHRQANNPHSCKICKKNFQKVSEFNEHNCNGGVPDNVEAKTTLPIGDNALNHNTGICIYNHDLQQIVPLENIIYISSEEPSIINDIHLLLCKSNDGKNDNLLCKEANRNNITILPQSTEENVSLEFNKNENNTNAERLECASLQIVTENALSSEQHGISADATKCSTEKSNEIPHYNIAVNIPVNVNHVLRKPDSEVESGEQTKSTEDTNSANKIAQCQEPMLRLVQTENGEQFYEFIISNMVEKSPEVGSTAEGKVQESATTLEAKESEQVEQELQRFASISNESNYVHYDLQSIDRTYSTLHHDEQESLFCTTPRKRELFPSGKLSNPAESVQHELLANDVQTEFDRYVETNFEVFEKLSYENSSEQFLELTEIPENNCEVSEYVETSHSFVQNDSEQLFEFLQVSQVDKNQTQAFTQIDYAQENVSMCNSKINEAPGNSDNNGSNESNLDSKESQSAAAKTSKTQTRNATSKSNATEEIGKVKKKSGIKFQCTECEKSFSSSYNYKQHIGTHFADQQKFHCKDCGLSFAWKTTLNKHMANYHRADGPQRFVCSLCPKVYGTSSQVNEHVKRDHWKHLNHTCSQCGKCFFKKYDLKIHQRTHTGERPYVCRSCGKRFHHRSHIIRHEQIHV